MSWNLRHSLRGGEGLCQHVFSKKAVCSRLGWLPQPTPIIPPQEPHTSFFATCSTSVRHVCVTILCSPTQNSNFTFVPHVALRNVSATGSQSLSFFMTWTLHWGTSNSGKTSFTLQVLSTLRLASLGPLPAFWSAVSDWADGSFDVWLVDLSSIFMAQFVSSIVSVVLSPNHDKNTLNIFVHWKEPSHVQFNCSSPRCPTQHVNIRNTARNLIRWIWWVQFTNEGHKKTGSECFVLLFTDQNGRAICQAFGFVFLYLTDLR